MLSRSNVVVFSPSCRNPEQDGGTTILVRKKKLHKTPQGTKHVRRAQQSLSRYLLYFEVRHSPRHQPQNLPRVLTLAIFLLLPQVGERYVFTVADSSRVDSFQVAVEEEGHNAFSDFDGPLKVKPNMPSQISNVPYNVCNSPLHLLCTYTTRLAALRNDPRLTSLYVDSPNHILWVATLSSVFSAGNIRGRARDNWSRTR